MLNNMLTNLIGGQFPMGSVKANAWVAPTSWETHRQAAGSRPGSIGIDWMIQDRLNPILNRCRIGKITLKTKA